MAGLGTYNGLGAPSSLEAQEELECLLNTLHTFLPLPRLACSLPPQPGCTSEPARKPASQVCVPCQLTLSRYALLAILTPSLAVGPLCSTRILQQFQAPRASTSDCRMAANWWQLSPSPVPVCTHHSFMPHSCFHQSHAMLCLA